MTKTRNRVAGDLFSDYLLAMALFAAVLVAANMIALAYFVVTSWLRTA